jgi:tRNA pseudouridine55 synthase
LRDGFLLIDKPVGLSSFNIVSQIRKKFGIKKAGHCGTLDPLADGLLALALGNATRLIRYLDNDKIYEFGVVFGQQTQTGDREGKVVKKCENIPSKENLLEVIPKFIGEIFQTPPAFSAIKIDGKRAYELARAGKEVEMRARKIEIFSLELTDFDSKRKIAAFRTHCSNGTYIRSLAQDIAESCDSLGFCSFIRRICVGNFNIESAVSVEEASEKDIISFENAIDFPKVKLDESDSQRIINGNYILSKTDEIPFIWLEFNGVIIALGKSENGQIKPISVYERIA